MPGQQETIELFNVPQNEKDAEVMVVLCQKIDEQIKGMTSFTFFGRDANSSQQFKQQSQQIQEALLKIAALEKELESIKQKSSATGKRRSDEEIRASEKLRGETKQRVDAIKAEGSAYDQLLLKVRAANREARETAAIHGTNSQQFKAAQASALQYQGQLNKINEGLNQHQHNVGNYLGSIKQFFGELASQALMFFGIWQGWEFIKGSIMEFINAQREATKLQNILSNLGRKEMFAGLNEEAERLSKTFGTFKKEDVTQVFDKLIVYGKLSKNQIEKLLPVIIDFAGQTGKTLPESTDILTKALEGNVRGLREFGIEIKRGNSPLENLKIIMNDLAPRVKGMGKAASEDAAGGLKKMQVEIAETEKAMGEDLIPVVEKTEKVLKTFTEFFKNLFSGNLFGNFKGSFVDNWFTNVKNEAEETWTIIKGVFDKTALLDLAIKRSTPATGDPTQRLKDNQGNIAETYLEGDKFAQLSEGIEKAEENGNKKLEAALKKQQKGKLIAYENSVKLYTDAVAKAEAKGDKKMEDIYKQSLAVAQKVVAKAKDIMLGDKPFMSGGDEGSGGAEKEKFDLLDKEIEARAKLAKLLKEEQIERLKIISESKDTPEYARVDSLRKQLELQNEIIKEEENYAILKINNDEKLKVSEINSSKLSPSEKKEKTLGVEKAFQAEKAYIIEKANDDLWKMEMEYGIKILAAHADTMSQLAEDEKMSREGILKEVEEYSKRLLDLNEKTYQRLKAQADENRDIELRGLQNAAMKGTPYFDGGKKVDLSDDKNYQREKQRIIDEANKLSIQHEIEYLQNKKRLAEGNDPTGASSAIIDAQIQAAKLKLNDIDFANFKTTEEKKKALREQMKAEELDLAKETEKAISSIIEGGYERQLNQVQKEIDANNKAKEEKINAIKTSSLSNQEAVAAEQRAIQEAAQTNEALQRKQRDIKIREAKFDRAKAVFDVVTSTIQAVAKDLLQATILASNPLTLPLAGMATAQAEIAGGIGLTQSVAILAKPIPTYYKSTKHLPDGHPGGPMIVGELGSELITTPDGKQSLSPDKPTLMYAPKGTEVLTAKETHDKFNDVLLRNVFRQQLPQVQINSMDKKIDEMIQSNNAIGQQTIAAIKKYGGAKINFYGDKEFREYWKRQI